MRTLTLLATAPTVFFLSGATPALAATTPMCMGQKATIVSTSSSGLVRGTSRADVIVIVHGARRVEAGAGNDLICGGAGSDTILAGDGDDRVYGGGGNDQIRGGNGNDALR